jgi:hypothetical protein
MVDKTALTGAFSSVASDMEACPTQRNQGVRPGISAKPRRRKEIIKDEIR